MDFFGNDFASFFDATPKAKKEVVKTKDSKEVKTSKETSGKTSKATKGNEIFMVSLPVTIKGRNMFPYTYEGSGEISIKDLADKLVENGFKSIAFKGMELIYAKDTHCIYIADSHLIAAPMNTALYPQTDSEEEDDEMAGDNNVSLPLFTVSDCQIQMEVDASMFDKAPDEISLEDVVNRFTLTNTDYEGCKLAVDTERHLLYPVFDSCIGECESESFTYVKDGVEDTYEKTVEHLIYSNCAKEIFGIIPGVSCSLTKTNSLHFVSYSKDAKASSLAYSLNPTKSVATKAATPVETKYTLPFTFRFLNINSAVSLTADMFNGKEKVSSDEVLKKMAEQYPILKDTSRKTDTTFDETTKTFSCLVISGRKGVEFSDDNGEEDDFSDALPHRESSYYYLDLPSLPVFDFYEYTDIPQGSECEGILLSDGYRFYFKKYAHFSVIGTIDNGREGTYLKSAVFHYCLPLVPRDILNNIISDFRKDLSKEMIVKLCYNKVTGKYFYLQADGTKRKYSIDYDYSSWIDLLKNPNILQIMDIHSHNTFGGYFSDVDTEDERFCPGVYGVIGSLDTNYPTMSFRSCIGDYFVYFDAACIFESEVK